LDQSKKIAVAVVVPIAGVALIVLAGLFFWRRRKQRMAAAEERRKEVEDYAYNPNNDPTLPNVGGAAGAYEMKEDASSSVGYRGWGSTTLAGSSGRKASTTMSGGAAGAALSDATSPTRGNFSDTRSGEPLMSDGSYSPEGEILGAMGPSSADNRGANVHRGASNASSSYSAAGRSDGSGENVAYGGTGHYDQYGNSNPYSDPYADNPNGPVQPVIRDNPARRNTRIENPSVVPQQSAGISQNF
jgi:LPXTG-motif cell wall-anchored protein